jgi:uncharacterized protein
MRDALPHSVDPRRLAELGRELTGSLSLARLPRLSEVVVDAADPGSEYARFELRFHRDASGRDLVEGSVQATLRLRCERCMGVLELPVSGSFTLAVVDGLDEVARLPEDYEPLLPDETTVDPAALVEDELLLAVPAVVRHPDGACHAPDYEAPAGPADDMPEKDNPFAVLGALRRNH